MATADQMAKKMLQTQVDSIEAQLEELNKVLKKYEPLFALRDRLIASRRALLSERAPTAGGGKGLTQEEIVTALRDMGTATVDSLAKKLSATPGAVRAHLARGNGERFNSERDNGVVTWTLREPEDDDTDDEGDDD